MALGRVATRGQRSPCWESNWPGDHWSLWMSTHTHTPPGGLCALIGSTRTCWHSAGHSRLWSLGDWQEPDTSELRFTGTLYSALLGLIEGSRGKQNVWIHITKQHCYTAGPCWKLSFRTAGEVWSPCCNLEPFKYPKNHAADIHQPGRVHPWKEEANS